MTKTGGKTDQSRSKNAISIHEHPRILIVDDDLSVHNLLREFLTKRGFYIRSAFNVSEARTLLEREFFDVVITDYHMPDGDGIEVVKFVRQNLEGTRILGMSGNESGNKFFAAGADSFIPKPFKVTAILQTLTDILRNA